MRKSTIVVAWASLAAVACDTPLEPEPPKPARPPDVRAFVAGAALQNLDAAGHFQLPVPSEWGGRRVIAPEWAEEIALAVIRTWITNPNVLTIPGFESLKATVEGHHGGPIDWHRIRPGPSRPFFAEGHLQPLPETMPGYLVRTYGPHYLVTLYTNATPVVSVGVSAHATEVWIDERGFVRKPPVAGGEFFVMGIPRGSGAVVPPPPEAAVVFAANETGAKIVEVPALGVPGNRVIRNLARWRLALDRPVALRRLVDGVVVTTAVVYVGAYPSIIERVSEGVRLRLFVAAENQPKEESIDYRGANDEVVEESIPLRDSYAVNLHEVRRVQ